MYMSIRDNDCACFYHFSSIVCLYIYIFFPVVLNNNRTKRFRLYYVIKNIDILIKIINIYVTKNIDILIKIINI